MNKLVLIIFLTAFITFKGYFVSQLLLDERSMGALVVSLGIALFVSSFILILKRGEILYALIINLILTVILYIQYLYIGYFKTPMSLYVFLQSSNAQGMGESIFGRFHITDLILFVDIIFLIVFYIYSKKNNLVIKNGFKKPKLLFLIVLIAAIGFISLKPVSMIAKGMGGEITRKYTPSSFVANYGIYGHQIMDGYQVFFQNKDIELSKEEKSEIKVFLSEKDAYKQTILKAEEGIFKNKNIVYLQMESLQNFVLNEKIDGKEITPFINSLLKNSIYFNNLHPQTAEGNSSDAELLALTSIYPLKEGSTFFRFPERNYPSTLKDLKEEGYESFAFHGDEGDFWNRNQTYPNLGFSKYYDIGDYKHSNDDLMGMGLSDKFFFQETGKLLEAKEEPFIGYAISLSSHFPFTMKEEEKTLKVENELKGSFLGNYIETIHYTDQSLKGMFDQLSEERKNNTVFVIYGDHNGIFSKDKKEIENWKDVNISDEEWLKKYSTVPFIIYNPGLQQEEIQDVAGQIDIRPTLSYLMGIEKEKYEDDSFGVNLFENQNKSIFLLKGDYGNNNVITNQGKIEPYGKKELKNLEYSEKLIKSNFK
jgi:phosphoglycerol transferase MdoB-like AlkP superfamily enzyme